jgi:hypothetical protein
LPARISSLMMSNEARSSMHPSIHTRIHVSIMHTCMHAMHACTVTSTHPHKQTPEQRQTETDKDRQTDTHTHTHAYARIHTPIVVFRAAAHWQTSILFSSCPHAALISTAAAPSTILLQCSLV